jgi:hypothetical protein
MKQVAEAIEVLKQDGKVYVTQEVAHEVEKELHRKDIPFLVFPLSPKKTMIELNMEKIIEKVFEDFDGGPADLYYDIEEEK